MPKRADRRPPPPPEPTVTRLADVKPGQRVRLEGTVVKTDRVIRKVAVGIEGVDLNHWFAGDVLVEPIDK